MLVRTLPGRQGASRTRILPGLKADVSAAPYFDEKETGRISI
jgi:translation initiation factor IF-1